MRHAALLARNHATPLLAVLLILGLAWVMLPAAQADASSQPPRSESTSSNCLERTGSGQPKKCETTVEAPAETAEPQETEIVVADPLPEAQPVTDDPVAPSEPLDLTGVRIPVGTHIQTVVNAHPAGTRYVLAAGTHRMQGIVPKDGDSFVGEPGAVMSGAKVLRPAEGSRDSQGRYVWTGQTQQASSSGNYGCDDWSLGTHQRAECGHEQEVHHGEEIFVTDGAGTEPRRLRHVNSLTDVNRPGTWYFDYAADRIYMYDDPASFHTVETSVTEFAFIGEGIRGVTIENLVIRHYANRAQRGALNGLGSQAWVIRHVDASYNHGGGIGLGAGTHLSRSRIAHNGHLGLHGTRIDGAVVTHNELAYNTALGFQIGWEVGGLKFTRSNGVVVAHNWVHHNTGKGIWFDIDNRGGVIHSNRVEHNTTVGIFWEISHDAKIFWNEVFDNHTSGDIRRSFGSIQVVASQGVEVFENWVRGHSTQEIMANHQDRGPSVLRDLHVYRNDVTVTSPWGGGQVGVKNNGGTGDPWSAEFNNRYSSNTYRILGGVHSRPFYWAGAGRTPTEWRAQHPTETVLTGTDAGVGSLPAGAVAFTLSHYGPR